MIATLSQYTNATTQRSGEKNNGTAGSKIEKMGDVRGVRVQMSVCYTRILFAVNYAKKVCKMSATLLQCTNAPTLRSGEKNNGTAESKIEKMGDVRGGGVSKTIFEKYVLAPWFLVKRTSEPLHQQPNACRQLP